MRYPTTIDEPRRRRLVVLVAAVALPLIAFITYAALVHRAASSDPPPGPGTGADPALLSPGTGQSPSADTEPSTSRLAPLHRTSDPETFARDVADALFEWDTATLVDHSQHVERLVAAADPTGESTPGLLSDLDNYLPIPDAWTELARYETRQWLSIDSVTTPTTWATAEAQAGSALLPGTTAFTIHGTRHRAGVWEGDQVASEHEVAFTVFIVCAPSYPECHLLRLSALDKPLE